MLSPREETLPRRFWFSPTQSVHRPFTLKFRLLGLLPLGFFIAQGVYYWGITPLMTSNLLFPCNIGNLILSVGLLIGSPWLIRMAVVWLLPGIGFWIWYNVIGTYPFWGTTMLVHLGGLVVGLIALSRVRGHRWMWLYGLFWFLFLQQISRLVLPSRAELLNINLAYGVWEPWDRVFGSYAQFWLALTLFVAGGLWFSGFILNRLFPPHPVPAQSASDAT